MLTSGQVAFFKTFGFLFLPRLFTGAEVAIMKREAGEIFAEDRESESLAEDETQDLVTFWERKPYLSELLDDDRIQNIAADLLGPNFVMHATTGARRVGDTPWHADMVQEDPLLGANITFYTEPLMKSTGCLSVIPGSHIASSLDQFEPLRGVNRDSEFRPFGLLPSQIPCHACESMPGDVIVFNPKLLHAAFGSNAARHMHLVSFFANPTTEKEIASIRALYEISRWGLHPAKSHVNSARPRIRRMVSRLVELGFETSKV